MNLIFFYNYSIRSVLISPAGIPATLHSVTALNIQIHGNSNGSSLKIRVQNSHLSEIFF